MDSFLVGVCSFAISHCPISPIVAAAETINVALKTYKDDVSDGHNNTLCCFRDAASVHFRFFPVKLTSNNNKKMRRKM